MKGWYHITLRDWLARAMALEAATQDSLGSKLNKDQTTVGKYLKGHPKSGALDLDEADLSLRHFGSNLKAFVESAGTPPVAVDVSVLIGRLTDYPEFTALVEALNALPVDSQPRVMTSLKDIALLSVRPRRGGRRGGRAPATRNTKTE